MQISTRPAELSDLNKIAALFDLYRQFYEQSSDFPGALHFIEARMIKQESVILVAEAVPTDLIGFCQLYPSFCSVEAKPIFILYDLFVVPSARKHGAGRQLLRAAERLAANYGMARLDLSTARDNHPAQSLYESLGWQRDDVFHVYSLPIA